MERFATVVNPLSANPTKWSNTLKQFVGKFPTNCLSVFDHLVGLALKGLTAFPQLGHCLFIFILFIVICTKERGRKKEQEERNLEDRLLNRKFVMATLDII